MQGVIALALTTYREAIRSKILYSVFFFLIALLLLSAFFGSVTVGDQLKVIKDFGLTSLSLFSVIYIILIGTSLLHKELEQKTVFVVLARPISRSHFILGKFLGLALTLTLLTLIMATVLSLFVLIFEGRFDSALLLAYFHIYLQSLIICAVTIFFSALVVTPLLSGAFSFALFVAGRSTEYLLEFSKSTAGTKSDFLAQLLEKIYYIVPHLDKIDLSDNIVNQISTSPMQTNWAVIYTFSYSLILILLACLLFARKEFK
jgi:Cu-processing system permease protein